MSEFRKAKKRILTGEDRPNVQTNVKGKEVIK